MRENTDGLLILITEEREHAVRNSLHSNWYRKSIVGVADAHDPLFAKLKELVNPNHLTPRDLLPQAKAAISFFLPFSEEIVLANQKAHFVAREWAVAYIETNRLISEVCLRLSEAFQARGIASTWEGPTHNFDEVNLTSHWSHKHVAYICGLGSFGLHQMLITSVGCAGRIGSILIDSLITPSEKADLHRYCGYYQDGSCNWCLEVCPVSALTRERFDRQRCYKQLLKVNKFYSDLDLCDVCGKCAVGPCALGPNIIK